jgi:hypothetical protein
MNRERSRTAVFIGFGLLVFGFGSYYFTRPETWKQSMLPAYEFARDIRPGWAIQRPVEVKEIVQGIRTQPFERQIGRALWSRWLLKHQEPRPWDLLMENYSNGLWVFPSRPEVEIIMSSSAESWVLRRRDILEPFQLAQEGFQQEPAERGILLRLRERVEMVKIGTVLELSFQGDYPSGIPAPGLMWYSDLDQYPDATRSVLGISTLEEPNAWRFDFSHESDWLRKEAMLKSLELVFPPGMEDNVGTSLRVEELNGAESVLWSNYKTSLSQTH